MNGVPENSSHIAISIALGAVCSIGIAGNVVQILVLKPKLPESVICLVRQLHLADLIILTTYGAVAVPMIYNGSLPFVPKLFCMVQQVFAFQSCLLTLLLSVSQCVTLTNADCCVGRTLASVIGAYTSVALCWLLSIVALLLTRLMGCGADFSIQRPHFAIECSNGRMTDQGVFLLYLYVQLIAPALLLLIHAGVIVSFNARRPVSTTLTLDSFTQEAVQKSPKLIFRSFAALAFCFTATVIYWSLSDSDHVNTSFFITFTAILNSSMKPFLFYIGKQSKQVELRDLVAITEVSRSDQET